MSKNNTLQTLSRSIRVLKLFSPTQSEFSLTEFNEVLDISKSILQRILRILVHEVLLDKNHVSKMYKPGLQLYFLGKLVESKSQLISISQKYMEKLNQETGETITLNIINQNKRQCIGYVLAKHELSTLAFVSNESPLYAGASAKTLLAFMAKEKKEKYLNSVDLERVTEHTITNKNMLINELDEIQTNGYSITESERVLGVFAVSSPILNRFGEIIASLTITIPSVRANKANKNYYINLVLKYSKLISTRLEGNN